MPLNPSVQKGESKEEYRKRIAVEMAAELEERRQKMISGEVKMTFDVDDFGFLLPGYDDLLRVKRSLPNLKATMFSIPLDSKFFNETNSKHFKWKSYERWAQMVNELDWLEIAFHGFAHVHNECDVTYEKSITLLKAIENVYDRVGLEYVKIIKAPYWQMSYDFMAACRDRGYVVAIDRDRIRPVPKGLETYMFNWSFQEPLPLKPLIKGHGHFTGRNSNNIKDTLHNILSQIPKETQFMFVSEYLKKYGNDTKEIERYYSKEG